MCSSATNIDLPKDADMLKSRKIARVVAAAGVAAALWNVALPVSSTVVNAGVSLNIAANGVSLN